jgi:60 kDa SS-A/Ro ribonucleoprotein
MSKFNKPQNIETVLESRKDVTINHEGEMAFKIDVLTNLYLKAVTSFVSEQKYYEDANTSDRELLNTIYEAGKVDPEFVLQLAIYCRENMYLRSVPMVMLVEFANRFPGKVEGASNYVFRGIQRVDEITEMLALQFRRNKIHQRITNPNSPSSIKQKDKNTRVDKQTPVPIMLKKGIAKAFNKFNEYNFDKYDGNGMVKLKDALYITHPKAKSPAQQELFDKIISGNLKTAETWEVMRSSGHSWDEIMHKIFYKDGRVNNYMALLRNIRNIMSDPSIKESDVILLSEMLSNREAVLHSKQFPFRFLSAYLVAKDINSPYINMILDSLETAVKYSVENMPQLEGLTVIANDFSGSMDDALSTSPNKRNLSWEEETRRKKYELHRCDIGELLGMISNQFCQRSITGIFGDTWKVMPTSKYSGILNTTVEMRKKAGSLVGCSTNGYLIPQYLMDNNIKADRILLFTDCQLWNSNGDGITFATEFIKYQRKYPNVKLYTWDLSGYGTFMLPQDTKNVCLFGGFSDKVFDFIPSFENLGKSNIIQTIKSIKP